MQRHRGFSPRLQESVEGEGVNDGDVGDGDNLTESQEAVSLGTTLMLRPSLDKPAFCSRPGSLQRAGSSHEAMPARCTTRRKIQFRMSWCNVVSAGRTEHRIPWSTSVARRVAPHLHCTEGMLGGKTVVPKRWRRPVWNSALSSSRARVSARLSSHAETGRHALLRRLVRSRLPHQARPSG
jgi:hypothetical protein